MRRLFIAEKPELAEAICAGLGNKTGSKSDGYYTCGNDIVTWCYGHMLRLSDPEEYDQKYSKWNLDDLPFSFIPWQKMISDDKQKQVKIIFNLVNSVDAVVNAGDPDDEGQLLVDELLEFCGNTKPVYRVLINDFNLKLVQKALANIRPNSEFQYMSAAAEARSVGDQLYGYNMTRGYTLKARSSGFDGVLSVGRVQTPILGLVVRRCREFKAHKQAFYYNVSARFDITGCQFNGRYQIIDTDQVDDKKRLISAEQAQKIVDDVKGKQAKVISAKTTQKETPPVLPYNLLKLQADASRKYGYKPDKVKEITQALREKHQLITYNRSDCEYLSDEQHEDAPGVLAAILETAPIFAQVIQKADPVIKSRAFNSSKVSAHHAIIPTEGTADFSRLSEAEQRIYLLIARAYIAQFFPNMKYDETEIYIECEQHKFKTVSNVVTDLGWKKLYKNDADNDDIKENDEAESVDLRQVQNNSFGVCIDASSEKKATKPQPLYTIATLLKDLTRVAKYVRDPELKKILVEKDKGKEGENGGIGTPATRDSIIAGLLNRGFIVEEGKNLIASEVGEKLYDALPDSAKFPDMTAIWHDQQKTLKNKDDVVNFVRGLMEFISTEIEAVKNSSLSVVKQHECPGCKMYYLKRITPKGKDAFWACSDRDNCGYTAPDAGGLPGKPKPKPAVSAQHKCKTCGKGLIRRTGKKGKVSYAFWGCSGFPECKESYKDDKGKPNYTSNT